MHRKTIALTIALAVAATLLAPAAFAGETKPAEAHKKINAKEALFSSATLTENPAKIKDLAKALGTQKGVLSAKFDDKTKLLHVVFDPAAGSIKAIEKALGSEIGDLNRKELKDITWEKKDCGKCPSKSKCAKAKETGSTKNDAK